MATVNKGFESELEGQWDNVRVTNVDAHRVEAQALDRSESCIDPSDQITFSWDNISVSTSGSSGKSSFFSRCRKSADLPKKNILQNVNGYVKPGQLLAIMGASGAGKSTLLNTLTFRNLGGLKVESGKMYANGVQVSANTLTSVSAYVQQDDLFIGTLTVREHLVFQARVRMDKEIPYQARIQRIDQVIRELGLKKCENTLIGIAGRIKGISGGEAKRLSFASEVLTNPPLMFCDEPTSGLDSYMAQNVIEVLKEMANQGRTIVATIHQPSSQVFSLFDRLLLMAEGKVAFLGDSVQAQYFFANAGYPCPMNYNPADHYVHVLAVTPGYEDACRSRVTKICKEFEADSQGGVEVRATIDLELQMSKDSPKLKQISKSPYKASWWEQFKALLWRSWLAVVKEPMIMKVRFIQTIMIALMLGVIYLGQDSNSRAGVMNINGALFLLLTNMTFSNMFAVVQVFCMELPIFLREHFNGMYRVDVYYICKQLAEFPLFVVTPVLFAGIFYYMVGMNPLFVRFCICNLVLFLVVQAVVSFGYFISCAAPNLQVALALAPTLIIPFMLFGGFFLNASSIPVWLVWLKYLSWFLYSNELLMINQWDGVEMDCDRPFLPGNSTVGNSTTSVESSDMFCFKNGDEVISFYGFDKGNYAFDFVMLAVLAVGFRLLGYLILLSKTYRKK